MPQGTPFRFEGPVSPELLIDRQAELATLANLSRQTVNQLLRQAVAEGRLRSSYGRLWIRPAPKR